MNLTKGAVTLSDGDIEHLWMMNGPCEDLSDALRFARIILASQAVPDSWHEAVLNACMVRESCYVKADPAKTVQQLLQWEADFALASQAVPDTATKEQG